jgi:hypothetical protein
MKFTVVGYEVYQRRDLYSNGNASTTTGLRLSIQGTESPHGHRTTKAFITFGKPPAGNGYKIGHIEENPGGNGEAKLFVSLPATEFDNYWKILTHEQRPHVHCIIVPHDGVTVEEFTLATAGFAEALSP